MTKDKIKNKDIYVDCLYCIFDNLFSSDVRNVMKKYSLPEKLISIGLEQNVTKFMLEQIITIIGNLIDGNK
jgi:hypothetical protein